jgi:hypothetical protein
MVSYYLIKINADVKTGVVFKFLIKSVLLKDVVFTTT